MEAREGETYNVLRARSVLCVSLTPLEVAGPVKYELMGKEMLYLYIAKIPRARNGNSPSVKIPNAKIPNAMNGIPHARMRSGIIVQTADVVAEKKCVILSNVELSGDKR